MEQLWHKIKLGAQSPQRAKDKEANSAKNHFELLQLEKEKNLIQIKNAIYIYIKLVNSVSSVIVYGCYCHIIVIKKR